MPADPQSKGGSEATVRIAKADLVPTDHNLRAQLRELRGARGRLPRVLRARQRARAPGHAAAAGGDARARSARGCTRCRRCAHTVCFGETRKVSWQSTISVGGALYSVPCALVDERVWARADGDELVVVHADAPDGPREVARHRLTTPGRPSIHDEHYPPKPAGRAGARPDARRPAESARSWRSGRARAVADRRGGGRDDRVRRKMAEAVDSGQAARRPRPSSEALTRRRADAGRFDEGDLAAILAHHQARRRR